MKENVSVKKDTTNITTSVNNAILGVEHVKGGQNMTVLLAFKILCS